MTEKEKHEIRAHAINDSIKEQQTMVDDFSDYVKKLEAQTPGQERTPIVKIKVRYDEEWDEYIVEVRIDGKLNKDKSYHATDKDDAIHTKHAMIKEAQEFPKRYMN